MTTTQVSGTKRRLYESERILVGWFHDMGAKNAQSAAVFGVSDSQIGASLRGQKATSGYRDVTGKVKRHEMSSDECDAILQLADFLLARDPSKRPVYDKIFAFLLSEPLPAAELEPAFEPLAEAPKVVSSLASLLDRIVDSYTALGEQIAEYVQRSQGVDEDRVIELVNIRVQQHFARLAGG